MIVRNAIALLLALAFCSSSRASDVRVRLFTALSPVQVEIVPIDATIRTCPECNARKIGQALTLVATANVVSFGTAKSSLVIVTGRYRLRAGGTATTELSAPLEIRSAQGFLRIVARMPVEQYVAFAIGGEAGGIKEPEALKAIAVAIRTYAVKFRARHDAEGSDLCDSTHCQVLRLSDSELWRKAAKDTEGEMLWYNGELAYAYHHASCGGTLEDGRVMLGRSVPYLRRTEDPVCSTGSAWDAQLGRDELRRAMIASGFRLGDSQGVAVTDRDDSGRARTLLVDGARIDATAFRMAVGRELGWNRVRSEMYDISDEGSSVLFHGRGRGHGVGLCQTGAQLRAQQGATYRDILTFYYPGTTIGVTARGLAWKKFSGERVELQTTSEQDSVVLTSAERMLRDVERRTGWTLAATPSLRVYPTVAVFRDATGEPGWVAASTLGRTIRLQPVEILKSKSVFDSTVRHELLHMLVEQEARPETPLWFREGVVLYLAGQNSKKVATISSSTLEDRFQHPKSETELKSAYAEANRRVAALVQKNGEAAVLNWVRDGLPRAASE